MSEKRIKMSNAQRAKQFLPFSAVRGLEEALERKRQEIITDERVILDESGIDELDKALKSLFPGEMVEIEYYDGRRERCGKGRVKCIIPEEQSIIIEDETILFIDIRRIRKMD
ncbi:MAG: hypothetical protein ACI4S4_07945 [Candidatus Ornithospirochaeta sp.]